MRSVSAYIVWLSSFVLTTAPALALSENVPFCNWPDKRGIALTLLTINVHVSKSYHKPFHNRRLSYARFTNQNQLKSLRTADRCSIRDMCTVLKPHRTTYAIKRDFFEWVYKVIPVILPVRNARLFAVVGFN